MLPHVCYETLLDKSIENLTYIIAFMALENLLMTLLARISYQSWELKNQAFVLHPFCPNTTGVHNIFGEEREIVGCHLLGFIDWACLLFCLFGLWPASILWLLYRRRQAMKTGSEIEEVTEEDKYPPALGGGRSTEKIPKEPASPIRTVQRTMRRLSSKGKATYESSGNVDSIARESSSMNDFDDIDISTAPKT